MDTFLNEHLVNFDVKNKMEYVLKYGSEEKGSSLCKCSILLGFFYVKKTREVAF